MVSSTPWSSLLITLSRLALAEKMYFSLPFIAKKFFRKDVNMYYRESYMCVMWKEHLQNEYCARFQIFSVLCLIPDLGQGVVFLGKTVYLQCLSPPRCINKLNIDVLRPILRFKWQRRDTHAGWHNKRSWIFRNLLLIVLNMMAMMSHENQEIIGKFNVEGSPARD